MEWEHWTAREWRKPGFYIVARLVSIGDNQYLNYFLYAGEPGFTRLIGEFKHLEQAMERTEHAC